MSTFSEIVDGLKDLGEAELEIVKAAMKDAANQFAPVVMDSARAAVQEAASLALPGTEKKEAAFKQIGADLLGKGIVVGVQVAVSMIYRMIECAYEWFMETIVGIVPGSPAGGPIGTT